MRHRVFGRKLSRTKNERRRLIQSLARETILHGRIETSLAKAKAVQPELEKLVTLAKKGNSAALIRIRRLLDDKQSVNRLLGDVKTRYSVRPGGYTRIFKTGHRMSDSSAMAILEFVDHGVKNESKIPDISAKIPVTKKLPVRTAGNTRKPDKKPKQKKSGNNEK
jgi:large subunit ribosomal protein L17